MNAEPLKGAALSSKQSALLRRTQLELLCELDRVCRKNGYRYFAIAGTALGAVRHQGFIPWDDDLDVGMPRRDFDALVAARDEFGKQFFLQHHSTDTNFPLPMAKLRRNDSLFLEAAVATVDMHQGIFIDIFPIDRKPRLGLLQHGHLAALTTLSRLARSRAGYELRQSGNRSLALLLRIISRRLPMRWLTSSLENVLRLFAAGQGPLTIAGGSYGYRREWFDDSWLESLEELPFELVSIPVFSEHDAYLRHLYGTYWTLPPIDERVSPHSVTALTFPPNGLIDDNS